MKTNLCAALAILFFTLLMGSIGGMEQNYFTLARGIAQSFIFLVLFAVSAIAAQNYYSRGK